MAYAAQRGAARGPSHPPKINSTHTPTNHTHHTHAHHSAPLYSASRSPSARSSRRSVPSMHAASTQLWSLLTARRHGAGRGRARVVGRQAGRQADASGRCHPPDLRPARPHQARASRPPRTRTPHASHRVVQLVCEQAAHAGIKPPHAAVHRPRQYLGTATGVGCEMECEVTQAGSCGGGGGGPAASRRQHTACGAELR